MIRSRPVACFVANFRSLGRGILVLELNICDLWYFDTWLHTYKTHPKMRHRSFQKLQEKLPTPKDDWLRFKPLSQSKSQTHHVTGVNAGKHTYREWRLRQFFPPVKGVTSQYLLRNLRQSSPFLMILVSYWFILASVALIFSNKPLIKY